MTINNVAKRIKQIQAYDSSSEQSITEPDFGRRAIDLLDDKVLSNPETTYLDPQCGSGTLLLYLVERLMTKLEWAFPDETKRLEHIFSKQIFASDLDSLQALVCVTNFKKATNNRKLECNVRPLDYKKIRIHYDVVLSGIDFATSNHFIDHFRKFSKHLVVLTRPNKHRYTKETKVKEITKYRFLGVTGSSSTPISAFYFDANDQTNDVTFITDYDSVVITDPQFLPGGDLKQFAYACEVLQNNFSGYKATYGSYYSNDPAVVNNPGDVTLIYGAGDAGSNNYGRTIKVDKSILTDREGYGKHKVIISKNGNRGRRSVCKYASPEYGMGSNALWIEVTSKKDAEEFIEYYDSKEVVEFVIGVRGTSPANGKGFWDKFPHKKHQKTLEKIYQKYYTTLDKSNS